MSSMFRYAEAFNSELVWDTSKVNNLQWLFDGANAFNQRGIADWDVGKVGDR